MVNRTRRFAHRKKRCARSILPTLTGGGQKKGGVAQKQKGGEPPKKTREGPRRLCFPNTPGGPRRFTRRHIHVYRPQSFVSDGTDPNQRAVRSGAGVER